MSEFLGWLVNVMLFFFVFFFVPASIVTLIAYFSKVAEKRKIWQHILMFIVLIINSLIYFIFINYLMELAIVRIDSIMIAATSLLVFSILCLITLRKTFLLRTQYWFRKLFHYDLSQKDFGKPITNNWLIGLAVISILIAYFTGLSYNIQQFFLHDYRAHTLRFNIFLLIYDFAMYYIWRSLLFVKKNK